MHREEAGKGGKCGSGGQVEVVSHAITHKHTRTHTNKHTLTHTHTHTNTIPRQFTHNPTNRANMPDKLYVVYLFLQVLRMKQCIW